MNIDLATRRSIRKLTRADLQAFPVWEWAVHEEEMSDLGESVIRPTKLEHVPTGVSQQFIVAASAILNDGSRLPAVAEVSVHHQKVRVAPLFLFLKDHRLDFSATETITMLSHFTKVPHTWPVKWELSVPVDGDSKPRSGRVAHGVGRRLALLWARLRSPRTLAA